MAAPKLAMVTKARVPAETFVREWQRAGSKEDFCRRTGLASGAASTRATSLRRRGVPLKRFPRGKGTKKLDIPALAALAKSLA